MKKLYSNHRKAQQGFTLVVVAALFIAFSVVAAAIVERNSTMQSITRRDATMDQLRRLSNAILEYGVANKSGTVLVYPCPALVNVATTGSFFGVGVSSTNGYTNDCSSTVGDVSASPNTTVDGLVILGAAGTDVIIGMVPVRDLMPYGIGPDDAFDAWGDRIMYVVNRKLTSSSAALATDQPNNPTLTDNTTGLALASPDFILISYGRDGAGGYKRPNSSTTATIACPTSGAPLRSKNCDGDNTFYITPTYMAGNAVSATYFDDILVYFRQ